MRVLIAGAGPAGLTTAVELARLGVSATVVDRKADASTLSRAVGIMPRSLNLLAASGVSERLLAEGVKMRAVRVYSNRHRLLTIPLEGAHPDYGFALALAQDRTEAALRDALRGLGSEVRYATEVTGLTQSGDEVVVQTRDGAEAAYDFVVGADGISSTVRQALGLRFDGFELPKPWSIADVDAIDWPNAESFTVCLVSGGRVAVVAPLEANRYRVVSNTPDALDTLPLDLNVTRIHRQGQFTISIRQVADYSVGRVYLVGDAAHCHSPVGGRGMNLGIADGAELASRLASGNLSGYTQSRHAAGAATIAMSERGRRAVTSANPLRRGVATTLLRVVGKTPALRRRLAALFLGD